MIDPVLGFFWNFTHRALSGGDLLVHTGQIVLHAVTINSPATTLGDLTIRDGTDATGTIVAVIDMQTHTAETAVGVFTAGDRFTPTTIFFDIQLTTGLFLDVNASGGADVTIMHSA